MLDIVFFVSDVNQIKKENYDHNTMILHINIVLHFAVPFWNHFVSNAIKSKKIKFIW